MKAGGHFAISLIGAGFIYSLFSNFISAVIFFVSCFFIDLDHIFDFVPQHGLKNLNIGNLRKACYEDKLAKSSLVFHSFELILILWIIITVYKLNIFWIAFALGLSIHLIIDQFTNKAFALTYFFTYRWLQHFNTKKLFVISKRGP